MSEETKKRELSEDDLDNVAGGSFEENQELLNVMMDIDPKGTENLLKTWDQKAPNAQSSFNDKMQKLMNANFKGSQILLSSDKIENLYTVGGKRMSHGQFVDMLKSMGSGNDF